NISTATRIAGGYSGVTLQMYILSKNRIKFHLKSVPLINAYLWRDKTILQRKKYDKYDKQTRDHNSLLSPWRL
ncbi:MAG: hypothetical protein ACLFT4_10810, partial [Bacteroidales bacterium]